jgi:hypothetical protein
MIESEYEPLWTILKQKKKLSLSANRLLHARIYKAITKRKNLDIGYMLEIEPRKAMLSKSRDGSKLTIYLKLSLTQDEINNL